ncbi:MAG: TIGR02147 family protein [Pseudobdellovibrionaceae bacterium]
MDQPNIFSYSSSGKYLKDMFGYHKSKNPKFSMIYFSKQIGLSGSYLKLVLAQKRRFSLDAAVLLAKKFRLNHSEKSFLIHLILKENAETPSLKNHFESHLIELKKQNIAYNTDHRLNSIFSNSLTWEIFSMIGVDGFSPDPRWIIQRLKRRKPSIQEIEESLSRLKSLGAIEFIDGRIKAKDIVSKHSVDLQAIYLVALQRAMEHLKFSPDEKSSIFDSFCLILSEDEYEQIRNVIENTKQKIASIATRKGIKTRIAYYNANLFFASNV